MSSWSSLDLSDLSALYSPESESEPETSQAGSPPPPSPDSSPSSTGDYTKTTVAYLRGESRDQARKAATVVAAAYEENLQLASMEVDDANMPQLTLNAASYTPMEIAETVNSLLHPLRPYVFQPRQGDLPDTTSDWAESVSSSPPLSPSSSLPPPASLSPIPTPLSPPTNPNYRIEGLLVTPRSPERTPRLEFRTSTARTPLQAVLETVNQELASAEKTVKPLNDPDSTMKSV